MPKVVLNSATRSCCSTNHYDAQFGDINGLTWLPWVGADVPYLSAQQRLLVVGESHYPSEVEPSKIVKQMGAIISDRNYTRDIVQECPVNLEWRNPTLENIARFLLGANTDQRAGLWSGFSFYNFVQRPMDFKARKERPSWEDWVKGWKVFLGVINVLKPTHCIFIGVEAAKSFDWVMNSAGVFFEPVEKVVKVRRTWARKAKITQEGQSIGLSFMRHCGAHFSWLDWHSHLKTQCCGILDSLRQRHFAESMKSGHSSKI